MGQSLSRTHFCLRPFSDEENPMSLFRHINEISGKGSLEVRSSMMQPIARICTYIIIRTKDTSYNWDVIALYFAPPTLPTSRKSATTARIH